MIYDTPERRGLHTRRKPFRNKAVREGRRQRELAMELKDKFKLLLQMFDSREGEHFSDTIQRILNSPDRNTYFDKYLEVFDDLGKDELRSCWQFWFSDRVKLKQDFTPEPLANLCAHLLTIFTGQTLYDCCAGSGALTIAVWNVRKDILVQCVELDESVIPLLLFNIAIRNIEGVVINGNALTGASFQSWGLIKGEKYATIMQDMFPAEIKKADLAICNPPYNFRAGGKLCNFDFIKICTELSDRAVVLLPGGTKTSKEELPRRRELCEQRLLQAVIDLPENMFESTGIPVTLYVLDKREKDKAYLIDATKLGEQYIREQRGEGSELHTKRIYKKRMVRFNEQQIAAIQEMTEREAGVSLAVTYKQMKEKDYSFSRGMYLQIDIDESHTVHRSFNDIINDINRINRIRNTMKLTINQVWAKHLGFEELLAMSEQDKELSESINEQLCSLGIQKALDQPDYIAKTNSKELKLVQVDKEILSPVFESFLPLWKQHIRTMNDMSIILFQELRDALLEPLLTGRIGFTDGADSQIESIQNDN